MVRTAEGTAQLLREKNGAVLGTYARLQAANEAAHRAHRLTYSAMTAYAHHSHLEAAAALRSVQHAVNQVDEHVDAALCGIDTEAAR